MGSMKCLGDVPYKVLPSGKFQDSHALMRDMGASRALVDKP